MIINDLPNELLLMIFMRTPWVEDMVSCSRVCQRWSDLAAQRLSTVKYLLGIYEYNKDPSFTENDVLYYHHNIIRAGVLENLVHYLPNLRTLEIIDAYKMEPEFLAILLKNGPPIKGLRYLRRIPGSIDESLTKLEMISTNCMTEAIETLLDKLTQVYIVYSIERTLDILSNFSYLKRVHIHDFVGNVVMKIPSRPFMQLEILELGFKSTDRPEHISLAPFINICPNLKSLYLRLEQHQLYDLVPPSITMSMEDVVLEYDENCLPDYAIPQLLESFPNLKNLALRRNTGLTDYEVRQILANWTQLNVLDVRGCRNITSFAPLIVDKFAHNMGKKIQFFWGDYTLLRLTTREVHVCSGFNFMANAFHRQFSQLPSFLDDYEDDDREMKTKYVQMEDGKSEI